jgi:hypothetical protein
MGWVWAVWCGEIPPRTFTVILFNDLIWWYPFAAYLLRRSQHRRTFIALLAISFHLAASTLLLVAKDGTEAQSDIQHRMEFIHNSTPIWTTCWFLWTAASLGLFAFFVVWANHLRERGASLSLLAIAIAVCGVGLMFDLASEAISITKVANSTHSLSSFQRWSSTALAYGAGVGNGLYCIAGILMSVISWQYGFQRSLLSIHAALVWLCGLALTASLIADQYWMMAFLGAALMVLFIPWATITGFQMRIAPSLT